MPPYTIYSLSIHSGKCDEMNWHLLMFTDALKYPSERPMTRLEGDDISMSVVMAPLWAVDVVLVLAPVSMAIAVAVRRVRRGEPVEAMLVSPA